jgi:uncharacterized membrane protein
MKIVVCHRLPERSFRWRGKPLPVCARCTGVMLGQLLGLTALVWAADWRLCILAMIPLLLDWSAQCWLSFASTNFRRVLTGFLAGYGEVALGVLGVRYLLSLWCTGGA